jgi:Na+/proline symporter
MSFLIPIGVVCYAAIGGLKATFTTSYMHTVIIYIVCLVFMFKVLLEQQSFSTYLSLCVHRFSHMEVVHAVLSLGALAETA